LRLFASSIIASFALRNNLTAKNAKDITQRGAKIFSTLDSHVLCSTTNKMITGQVCLDMSTIMNSLHSVVTGRLVARPRVSLNFYLILLRRATGHV
jgi:hypothetical protein